MLRIVAGLLACCLPLPAQMSFGKVELRTNYRSAGAGENGRLSVSRDRVRFTHRGHSRFTIEPAAIMEIFYSRVAGRRIKSAIGVGIVFFPAGIGLLFSKGKKHYVTLSFDEEGGEIGAVEFQLHKSNYRGTLRALEEVTGLTMMYDQEGVKASRETVASRGTSSRAVPNVVLSITSEPSLAEVYIDGSFNGLTPRKKAVEPGSYNIEVRKQGLKTWSQTVTVEPDQPLEVNAVLERN